MTELVHILDDDADVRGALGSLLRSAGYAVALHPDPESLRAQPDDKEPACLILDIRLGTANGLDVQARLAEWGIDLPVILITGYGDIPMTVQGMKAGAVDFLPKPFDDEHILSAVASAIALHREKLAAHSGAALLHECFGRLTPREREIMGLVVTGLMNKQIAARLALSEITVKIHRGNVMRKMEAQSLADLVRMAETLGIRDASIHRFSASPNI
ncbi:MAG TPA: response regulator transcription factor [Sphingomonadaceae bacterium]|nr:response regulator transcription factor [Sphingomonadaceae bacterium]